MSAGIDTTEAQSLIFNLSKLQDHIASNKKFERDYRCLPKSTTLTFQACGPHKPPVSLDQRLLVGSINVSSTEKEHVWAHVNHQSSIDKADIKAHGSVNYYFHNQKTYTSIAARKFALVGPFSHIYVAQIRGPSRLSHLVLYYFLEQGYLDMMTFSVSGYENFKRVCAEIAEASPKKSEPQLNPVSQLPLPSAASENELNPIPSSKISTCVPSTSLITEEKIAIPSAAKRERDTEDNDKRPLKKSIGDEGLYHFKKLMQHVQSGTNVELEVSRATNSELEKKIKTLKQQRDIWEGDAKFVKEQLKRSEASRHHAQAKAEAAQEQVTTLETEKAAMVKEMETKDKLLRGEAKARRVCVQKEKIMVKELDQLRGFKAQFLNLAASLNGAEDTD